MKTMFLLVGIGVALVGAYAAIVLGQVTLGAVYLLIGYYLIGG